MIKNKGFTLIEVVIAIGIFAVLMVGTSLLLVGTLRGAKKASAQIAVRSEGAWAMNTITSTLRYAQRITSCSSSSVSAQLSDGSNISFSCIQSGSDTYLNIATSSGAGAIFTNSLIKTAAGSWATVRQTCQVAGGDLVTINDAAENAAVNTLCGGASSCWIGYNDQAVNGTWVWATGSSAYTNWNNGEPNGGVAENCGVLWNGPKWNDWGCNNSVPGICEITANGSTGNGRLNSTNTAISSCSNIFSCPDSKTLEINFGLQKAGNNLLIENNGRIDFDSEIRLRN